MALLQVPEQAIRRAVDQVVHVVEPPRSAEVRVRDLNAAIGLGIELPEQVGPGSSIVDALPLHEGFDLAEVIPVHGDEIVERADVRLGDPTAGAPDLHTPARGHAASTVIRRLAVVVPGRTGGIDAEPGSQARLCHLLAEHGFSQRGPADVAEAHEQDGYGVVDHWRIGIRLWLLGPESGSSGPHVSRVRAVAIGRDSVYLETIMRRSLLTSVLLLLPLVACDWGLGTDPGEITLDDVAVPPRNHATVMITEQLTDGLGREIMAAGTQYFFPLRTPPPLPELLFDAAISSGSSDVRIILLDETQTGEFSTDGGVLLQFGAPDGALFEPRTSCRVTVSSALTEAGTGRLQGAFDCPMRSDGDDPDMRVLVRFDHSP